MYTSHIKAGDVVSIRHYSGISPFKSIIIDVSRDKLRIMLTKDFAIANFLEGDPIVFGYELSGQIYIFGGIITLIDTKESIVELEVDKVEEASERRESERYPVSLYADIRTRKDRKKYLATIKDISYYGMKVYSKTEIEESQELDVDVYMDKNVLFLNAVVVRKSRMNTLFEYGLGIRYKDAGSVEAMKEYIKRLIHEQQEAIRKLRNI